MSFSFDPNKHKQAPIEAGEWISEIVNLRFKLAKTGTKGLEVTYQVVVGSIATAQIRDVFWITEAAFPRLANFALLFTGEPFNLDDMEVLWRMFGGKRVKIRVTKTMSSNNREYHEVSRVFSLTAPEIAKSRDLAPRVAPAETPSDEVVAPREQQQHAAEAAQDNNEGLPPTRGGAKYDDDIPF
jgi:acyl-CoA hydrolase